jgi:hypothetical protein
LLTQVTSKSRDGESCERHAARSEAGLRYLVNATTALAAQRLGSDASCLSRGGKSWQQNARGSEPPSESEPDDEASASVGDGNG